MALLLETFLLAIGFVIGFALVAGLAMRLRHKMRTRNEHGYPATRRFYR